MAAMNTISVMFGDVQIMHELGKADFIASLVYRLVFPLLSLIVASNMFIAIILSSYEERYGVFLEYMRLTKDRIRTHWIVQAKARLL
jgi:hypothetical protein